MHERRQEFAARDVALVAIGFSGPEALRALADHLRWEPPFLSDEPRQLYARLRLERARLRDLYNRGTIARYRQLLKNGRQLHRPVEDTRQLGADVVIENGHAVRIIRPPSPDTRPSVDELLALVSD